MIPIQYQYKYQYNTDVIIIFNSIQVIQTLLVAAVLAGPADIKILKQDQVVNPDGSYQY